MPELPEVETTRCGIEPHIKGKTISDIVVRQRRLRVPVTAGIANKARNQRICKVERRGKYLLLCLQEGWLVCHLGMSGSLRIVADPPAEKHDHIDIVLSNNKRLRFRDPRRFGMMVWMRDDPLSHKLLKDLGPEPLGQDFSGQYLYEQSRNRTVAIKNFIMNSRIVVGVGNIYASEALFMSGIHPSRPANRVSKERYDQLVRAIRRILKQAIRNGGTTLRDFVREDGSPGYFKQKLKVYHREDEQCIICGASIRKKVIGQRASFYCPQCQK